MKATACKRMGWYLALVMLLLSVPVLAQEPAAQDAFAGAMVRLGQGSMQEREQAIAQLANVDDPRSLAVLKALLDGRLLVQKPEGRLVIGQSEDQGYRISDAMSGDSLGVVEGPSVSKINLTNKLRVGLRKLIGQLQLNSNDPQLRLEAVNAMAKDADEKSLALLKSHQALEKDEGVQKAITLVFLLQDMDNPDRAERMKAIEALKDYDSQEGVNRLKALVEKESGIENSEADIGIQHRAVASLQKIEARQKLYASIETVFFGLSLGAVLVLAAIGLAITFGVMGVINMAHGELMMLGAYTTYVIQQLMPNHLGLSVILAIPAAFLIAALTGIAIERGIIRYLYGRPLETLLATFGVSLILQQSVRSIFSPLNRSVTTPDWMSGSLQINDFLSLTWNRFYILIFCLMVFVLLLQILKHTRLGLEVRAVAQNRTMARAMGIPTGRVDAITFGLGSGIAGIAGVALSQITNVGPNLGQAYIVDSFMVVVFGGVGNLFGTLVAGFSLGIANKFLEPYAGAVLAKILVLVFIILFIQKRPRGLFPQKGRAAEA